MKIAYFFAGLGMSGGPYVHYTFMNGLVRSGHEVWVITPAQGFPWRHNSHLDYIGSARKQIAQRRGFVVRGICKAGRLLKSGLRIGRSNGSGNRSERESADVRGLITNLTSQLLKVYHDCGLEADILVATHTFTADAVYRLGRGRRIAMYSLHFEELMFSEDGDRQEINMLNHLPFNHIVNSLWLERMFQYNYGIQPKLINPGVDSAIFEKPVSNSKFQESGIRVITYCDPSRPFKGLKQQIAILREFYYRRKNVKVFVYGDDPQTQEFPYRFLGWLDHRTLAEYYSRSHILLSASWYESFPYPPIESMAAGCIPFASRYGTEEYLTDGETGVIINPFDTDQAVNRLLEISSNPKLMIRIAEQAQVASRQFPWDRQVGLLESALLNARPPANAPMNLVRIMAGELELMSVLDGSSVPLGES